MEQVGATAEDISCIGITNQRATTVIWDKETGKPLCKAIVWQDTRTADRCAEINASEWGKKVQADDRLDSSTGIFFSDDRMADEE